MGPGLDAIDRALLFYLQEDAHQPFTELADKLGVANNTVRNRITKLEQMGVIRDFTIEIDYGNAAIPHHYLFICTAQVRDRERLANRAADIPGVTRVTTLMTGVQNVVLEAVAPSKEALRQIALDIDEQGLAIEREQLIWSESRQAYAGFRPGE